MMKKVCIVGAGAIGSLYAAHLARVAEVWCLVRREEHAHALDERGLRVSGTHDFTVQVNAETRPDRLPHFDLGIVATKATQAAEAFRPVGHLFDGGAIISAQNGLGSEEILAALTRGKIIRACTFMSGTRHSDSHVQYELDTPTWLGPFEPTGTPFSTVKEAADLIVAGGLKAEALEDCRPAQWSKLIFNASVNAVSALTDLPHCREFAEGFVGDLMKELIEEGKSVAAAAGIRLQDDPWEMNRIGCQTDHPTSMLYDVRHRQPTEIDFLCGAIAREAVRLGVPAPRHTAMYQLIKGRELSWEWESDARKTAAKHALDSYRVAK
ncbi:MAG TPA: 2-dehydropantoate 2-reductase [Terriglobales bacterium]|nr:2-dehydropantoate 2-reductase [Terriglobales bacterium]